jgi:hypothetical protein
MELDASAHSINELYEVAPDVGSTTSSRPNPLIGNGALNEAEFIDMRLSPQRSRAGVIVDIRWCDSANSNVALVVLTGLGKVAWSNDGNSRRHKWYSTRGYWTPTTSEFWRIPKMSGQKTPASLDCGAIVDYARRHEKF